MNQFAFFTSLDKCFVKNNNVQNASKLLFLRHAVEKKKFSSDRCRNRSVYNKI